MRTPERDREDLAAFLLRMRSEGPGDKRLMTAVESVPRRLFLPHVDGDVYADQSFPIPCGETAESARHAVRLVEALSVQPDSRILEVGTGSGYVTALLARLGARVTSLERYKTLVSACRDRLKTLQITNVTLLQEDGREGYAGEAPFDRILVHAASEGLPRAYIEQLVTNGFLVCPLGPPLGVQAVTRHQKVGSRIETTVVGPVRLQMLAKGVASIL